MEASRVEGARAHMPLIFFNVGWMSRYDGMEGDSIARGGKYNLHSVGHEVCNFTRSGDYVYGYVQPPGKAIRIEKLGASRKDASIENVTVIWTAGPEGGGTVVVGWYRNAIVYRHLQDIERPDATRRLNGAVRYRVKARASDAFLLPVDRRELLIPRAVKGGIGQSNVWFADKAESSEIVDRVVALIASGSETPFPDVDLEIHAHEGHPRLIAHLRRERNAAIVKAKKMAVLKAKGKLCCEACGFNFSEVYRDLDGDYCEVHHLRPLHKSDGVTRTELKDLAIVCSNCHRIIHRTDPMPSIDQLSHRLLRRFD